MKRVQVLFLWIALAMMPWIAAARTDAFYEQRLKAGKDALSGRRGPEAVDELRIAAFGFIDEPRLLSEALVYLTIAHNGLGRAGDVEATLTRFVDSERRAAGYDRLSLPPDVRVQFESLLTRQFSRAALTQVPSLAQVITPEAAVRNAVPPAVPPVAPPAVPAQQGAAPPTDARPTAVGAGAQPEFRPASPATPAVQTPAPRIAQNDVRLAQPAPVTPLQGDAADQARQLISTRRASQALPLLTTALEREPQRRELRLLLLQSAAMVSDWKMAMTQISLLRPFIDSEPVFMFYAAVAMWESSRPAEARELLERALPRLNRTPYVDGYVKKILPERTTS